MWRYTILCFPCISNFWYSFWEYSARGISVNLQLWKLCIITVPLFVRHFPPKFPSTQNVFIAKIVNIHPNWWGGEEKKARIQLVWLFPILIRSQEGINPFKEQQALKFSQSQTVVIHWKPSNINSYKNFEEHNGLQYLLQKVSAFISKITAWLRLEEISECQLVPPCSSRYVCLLYVLYTWPFSGREKSTHGRVNHAILLALTDLSTLLRWLVE